MPHMIEVSDDLFQRLQKNAVPFVDTPQSVIERAIRALEAGCKAAPEPTISSSALLFDAPLPPDLSFATVKHARVDGRILKRSSATWNAIMLETVNAAAARGKTGQALLDLFVVNSKLGKHETGGFTYIEGGDVSIQGQSANRAWQQTLAIAGELGIEVEVTFQWASNPKAANPGRVGMLRISGGV